MNSKWFYGVLFLILALLGVKMERSMLSNQEIVVKFTEDGFTQDQAQKAISEVKNQLQDVGVENIQIRELEDGALKISYYSHLAVSEIKLMLSDTHIDGQAPLQVPFKFPSDGTGEDFASYELNVYEIHKLSQVDKNIKGSPVEQNEIKEHLYIPISTGNAGSLDLSDKYVANKTSLEIYSKAARLSTLFLYSLPEVRAGPKA